ncbi:heparinase II/III family protein [Vibrio sp. F12]|uniref:heparinase II/III family protein n=1 Tax=Vibrio sp. F12 TaxID=2070776 RepID=UPI001483C5BD|nr:heparinase II/III family protein [Vibrio sp. F12]
MKMGLLELVYRFYELSVCYLDRLFLKPSVVKCSDVNVTVSDVVADFVKDEMSEIVSLYDIQPDQEIASIISNYQGQFFGEISYNGDLRELWEYQRFNDVYESYFSTPIQSRDEFLSDYILSWNKKNKLLTGISYISTMECAIRCINIYSIFCYHYKYEACSDRLTQLCMEFFLNNEVIIRHRISRFSSRGNHTLFEYAGIAVCNKALGRLKQYQNYRSKAMAEYDYQLLDDGSGIEYSSHYHAFNVDCYIFTLLLDDKVDKKELGKYIVPEVEYLSALSVNGDIVRIADSDSSQLIYRIFLTGILEANAPKGRINFENAGQLIYRSEELSFVIKYGELGMKPLCGHGHYDFLSLCVFTDRGLITSDAITYKYNHLTRRQFRSSQYHSMPKAGKDHLIQTSNFMWSSSDTGQHLLYRKIDDFNMDIFSYYNTIEQHQIYRAVVYSNKNIIVVDMLSRHGPSDSPLDIDWLLIDGKTKPELYTYSGGNLLSSEFVEVEYDFCSVYAGLLSKKVKFSFSEKTSPIISVFNFDSSSLDPKQLNGIVQVVTNDIAQLADGHSGHL